jgi:hypothetical protein
MHLTIGLFRGEKWTQHGTMLCYPCTQTPHPTATEGPRRARESVCPHEGRGPMPSHGMMVAQVDHQDPEHERSTWHAGRGAPSKTACTGVGGRPGGRRARCRPGIPRPRGRVPATAPGGTVPPCGLDRHPPPARGPARRPGAACWHAARRAYLRALLGCASGPGAARAVGWGDGGLCGVPARTARGRRGVSDPMTPAWASARAGAGRHRRQGWISAGRGQGEPYIRLRVHSCAHLVLPRHRERASQRGQRCHDPSSHSCCLSSPRVS